MCNFRTNVQRLSTFFMSMVTLVTVFAGLMTPMAMGNPNITFEETIPVPETVRSQYCNDPATNKGVEFLNSGRIFEPSVQTASPIHALTNHFPGDEFGEFKKIEINFTTGQSLIGVKVGLNRSYNFPVTAELYAYSSETPGTGFINSDTVNLGYGPTDITNNLTVTSAMDNIRSAMIEFIGPSAGNAAYEVIDNLTFSTVGPPCVTDTAAPDVQITRPDTNGQTIPGSSFELAFTATDSESGVAKIQVQLLDASGSEIESFYVCGAGGAPVCIYDVVPYMVSYDFYTYQPKHTRTIRVNAWDFASHIGQIERTINSNLPGPNMNLWATGIEITQAIQPWVATSSNSRGSSSPAIPISSTSAPFVKGKKTVVRVYPGIEGTGSIPLMGAEATLTCEYAPSTPCYGPSVIQSSAITIDPAYNNNLDILRQDANRTWNFVLPEVWTNMTNIRLTATVHAPFYADECPGCKDGANSLTVSNIDFVQTSPLKLHLLYACIRRKASDSTTTCDTAPLNIHQSVFQIAGSLFVQTYPVAAKDIQITLHNPLTVPYDGEFKLPNGDMTTNRMEAFHGKVCNLAEADTGKKLDDLPVNLIYFGIVPAPVTAVLGLGSRNCAIGKLDPGALYGDTETAAEEVGHSLGRGHAGCAVHDPPEGSPCDPIPAQFPCEHGGICTYGFDIFSMKVIAPGTASGIHTHDFMSYGDGTQWISNYTYRHLYNTLRDVLTAQGKASTEIADQKLTEEVLWVSGIISMEKARENPAQFRPFYHLSQSAASSDPGRGSYSLELQDADRKSLFTRFFEPEVVEGDPPDPEFKAPGRFSEILPFDENLMKNVARIMLKHENVVLAEKLRSTNRPRVIITSPEGGDSWETEGKHIITWNASDSDRGDQLYFLVQYSSNNGTNWSTLALDLTETFFEVDSAYLAGSNNALIRVLASDGVNTEIARSAPFRVGKKPPLVWITNPGTEERVSFQQGTKVILEGSGTDWEDGPLEDGALTWLSHRDGLLGTGHRLDVMTLSPGVHEIMLQAKDADDQISTATTVVEILKRPNSQPVAEAGPNQTGSVNTNILLNGTESSDEDGDNLSFHWSVFSKPQESVPVIIGADTAQPNFTADMEGDYIIELIVDDGKVSSLSDRVTVTLLSSILPRVFFDEARVNLTINSTKRLNLTLDKVPAGLSGYNITISLSNAKIAEIISVDFPIWATPLNNSSLPADSVWIKASDLNNQVKSGDSNVLLAALTVRGESFGKTNINPMVTYMDDDNGSIIKPEIVSGELEVGATAIIRLPCADCKIPTDPDSDGLYEDINGNGRKDFNDVVIFFENLEWAAANEPVAYFDFNSNGRIDFNDIIRLFEEL